MNDPQVRHLVTLNEHEANQLADALLIAIEALRAPELPGFCLGTAGPLQSQLKSLNQKISALYTTPSPATPEFSLGPTTPAAHDYLSTWCYHGNHDGCRRTCKFCPASCRCDCHKKAP